MLRFRPLPLIDELAQLMEKGDETAAIGRRNSAAIELFQCEGMQFIAKLLRDIQLDALNELTLGNKSEFNCGRLAAVADVRNRLAAISPDSEPVGIIEDDQMEEAFIYDSGFDIPYNTSG